MEELMKKWMEGLAGQSAAGGSPHPRVYIMTENNPYTQSLFKLDFWSFGVNKLGIYQQTESCWNWVATIDLAQGDELSIGVTLGNPSVFTGKDVHRLLNTFTTSCGVGEGDDFVIKYAES